MLERNVVELARPTLDALGELSGETINLAVPARHGVEHVAQVDSVHFLGTGQWLGRARRLSLHRRRQGVPGLRPRAASRAALTPPRPGHGHGSRARCVPSSTVVRRTDFATAIDELEPGLAAMAAPVRGARGDVIAALSITGPTLRMTPPRIAELAAEVLIGRGGDAQSTASATSTKESTPHDARGDPATALRRDAGRQRAGRQGRRRGRARAGRLEPENACSTTP